MVRRSGPARSDQPSWSQRAALRDGTTVFLRQIRVSDRTDLADAFTQLSAASRYLRFSDASAELSAEHLTYLTDVDHHDHEAIVALDVDHPDQPGVGVARYVREPFDDDVAEVAVTVLDAYQGRGAGTVLLGALAGRARQAGVQVFRSYVLAGNTTMLEVFDHVGAGRVQQHDGMWRVELPLPDPDRPHHTPQISVSSKAGTEAAVSEAARTFTRLALAPRTAVDAVRSTARRWITRRR